MRKALPRLLALLFVPVAMAPVAAAQGLFPQALTDNGKEVQSLMTTVTVLATITFLIVFVWLVVVIWRFREGSGHGRATHEKERHSLKMELTWTFIPLVVVLWIGYAAYGSLINIEHGIDQEDAKVDILITASQWDWAADYGNAQGLHSSQESPRTDTVVIRASPDGSQGGFVKDENAFVIPANVPVHFNITSSDVIHAWQVIDANRAFVMFIDANPLGANKYNSQTVALPEGVYDVQCNKMCLNPGHAYMKAKLKAVPQAEYDQWLERQRALVKTPGFVVAERDVTVTADGLGLDNLTVATKTRLVLNVDNPTGTPVTLALDGVAAARQVPANGRAYVAFDVGTAGAHRLTSSNGGSVGITAVDALPLAVELGAFRLDPDPLALESGKTYLITLRNTHGLPHNLLIGDASPKQVVAASPTVGPGGTDAFLVTAPAPGTYEMWCDVPGHYDAGMHGTVTVT